MKCDEYLLERIISEIKEELSNLSELMKEYQDFLQKYSCMDRYLLRTKASFFADFYMGVERVIKIIAVELNGGPPKGDAWHKRLLVGYDIKNR